MGAVRRTLGSMDDDPALVVGEHRLVRLEDRDIYIAWAKHKMNVKLAAQTLSSSVATAIDFLRTEAQLPEFVNILQGLSA